MATFGVVLKTRDLFARPEVLADPQLLDFFLTVWKCTSAWSPWRQEESFIFPRVGVTPIVSDWESNPGPLEE